MLKDHFKQRKKKRNIGQLLCMNYQHGITGIMVYAVHPTPADAPLDVTRLDMRQAVKVIHTIYSQ